MGVMACSRKNCENVMCVTYIPEIGYMCTSCKDEFRSIVISQNIDISTKAKFEIIDMLRAFKYSNKDDKDRFNSIDEFFNSYS